MNRNLSRNMSVDRRGHVQATTGVRKLTIASLRLVGTVVKRRVEVVFDGIGVELPAKAETFNCFCISIWLPLK